MSTYFSQFRFSYQVLFSIGFRPFFLLGSLFAVVLMLLWIMQLRGAFTPGMAHLGIYGALNLVILVMLIIGGRVIPFFTERATPDYKGKRIGFIEKAVVPVAVVLFFYRLSTGIGIAKS